MSSIINLKIDVTKLTKDKLFKGQKGTYANITVAANMDGESEYGDTHYVFEQQSKEEREAKTPKVVAKILEEIATIIEFLNASCNVSWYKSLSNQ